MAPQLEDLALQKYLAIIKKFAFEDECEIQRKVSKGTVQKICSNFAEMKGLAAIVVSVIYSRSKTVLHWETMRKVLEKSLYDFEVLKQKYCSLEKAKTNPLKENTCINANEKLEEITLLIEDNSYETDLNTYPNKYTFVVDVFLSQMLIGGNENVNPAENLLISLSLMNIKDVCYFVDLHSRDILSECNVPRALSFKAEMSQAIEELEGIATELKLIQTIQMTIKKYLDTGPYKTWEEVQSEFIQYLIRQPGLHLYANQLSEYLMKSCFKKIHQNTSLERKKIMVEACLHPALTKFSATEIPTCILLQLFPNFKNLDTLEVRVRIATQGAILEEDAKVFYCMIQYCTKLKHLHITTVTIPLVKPEIYFKDVLKDFLPTSLSSIHFLKGQRNIEIAYLDKMAMSDKYHSLHRLTLEANCNYPLHKSFKNLTAVTVRHTCLGDNCLFINVGSWLKEISFSYVCDIDIKVLADCCPSLEKLVLEQPVYSSPHHPEPLPAFNLLKEMHFITPYKYKVQEHAVINTCILCVLQNSPIIEKVVIILDQFTSCFQQLLKTNPMTYLQEFDLNTFFEGTFQGLVTANMAVQMLRICPNLSLIGGIEHPATEMSLSEIYPSKTFMCLSENAKQYIPGSDCCDGTLDLYNAIEMHHIN